MDPRVKPAGDQYEWRMAQCASLIAPYALLPRRRSVGDVRDALTRLARNAIADRANPAATGASAQGNQLGIADKEAATISNRAQAGSLAYE